MAGTSGTLIKQYEVMRSGMLELLNIKNLALIEDMRLEFHPGLNVLTGESGAGKSFILRALNFIMGERIQSSMVRPGAEKAIVEAMFELDGQELILRRELVAATGRSRYFLNDSLSSQDKIQSMRDRLLIHTSQHAQQKLLKPAFHREILDSFLPERSLVNQRNLILGKLQKLSSEKNALESELSSLREKRDYLEFQSAQIEKVKPRKGEEEELTIRREKIKSRAELAEWRQKALDILHRPDTSLRDSFFELKKAVTHLAEHYSDFSAQAGELENVRILLEDIDRSLRTAETSSDTMELESIESRLWELAQLRRKLNRSLESILLLEQEIKENISFLDQGELSLKHLSRKELELGQQLSETISRLDSLRQSSAQELKSRLENAVRTFKRGG